MEYKLINPTLLPYAKCHYCGIKNFIPFGKIMFTPIIPVKQLFEETIQYEYSILIKKEE